MEYKDFYLDYFFKSQNILNGMKAGENLKLVEDGLKINIDGKDHVVARFSKSFKEKLATYKSKGYEATGTEIRFIVSLTKKPEQILTQVKEDSSNPRTAPILLANLFLRKIR